MKILIVDDDENQREALSRMLKNRGFEIIEAEDPYEALITLATNKDHISAIISDLYFAKVKPHSLKKSEKLQKNGLDILLSIRKEEGYEPYRTTKFFLRTGGSLEVDENQVLAAGGNGFFIKTDGIDILVEKIKE